MKIRVIVHLVLLLMAAAGAAVGSEDATEAAKPHTGPASVVINTGAPALVVPEYYYNFGEVEEGAEYLHAFVIKNKGTGVLEIKKVQPG